MSNEIDSQSRKIPVILPVEYDKHTATLKDAAGFVVLPMIKWKGGYEHSDRQDAIGDWIAELMNNYANSIKHQDDDMELPKRRGNPNWVKGMKSPAIK